MCTHTRRKPWLSSLRLFQKLKRSKCESTESLELNANSMLVKMGLMLERSWRDTCWWQPFSNVQFLLAARDFGFFIVASSFSPLDHLVINLILCSPVVLAGESEKCPVMEEAAAVDNCFGHFSIPGAWSSLGNGYCFKTEDWKRVV